VHLDAGKEMVLNSESPNIPTLHNLARCRAPPGQYLLPTAKDFKDRLVSAAKADAGGSAAGPSALACCSSCWPGVMLLIALLVLCGGDAITAGEYCLPPLSLSEPSALLLPPQWLNLLPFQHQDKCVPEGLDSLVAIVLCGTEDGASREACAFVARHTEAAGIRGVKGAMRVVRVEALRTSGVVKAAMRELLALLCPPDPDWATQLRSIAQLTADQETWQQLEAQASHGTSAGAAIALRQQSATCVQVPATLWTPVYCQHPLALCTAAAAAAGRRAGAGGCVG
jgi:hypothetical protein